MFIVDKIPMVPNKNLHNIHTKLHKIFGWNEVSPFVGKTTQVFGYLKQL